MFWLEIERTADLNLHKKDFNDFSEDPTLLSNKKKGGFPLRQYEKTAKLSFLRK